MIHITELQNRIPLWFSLFVILGGVLVLLPFLAPVFMTSGWSFTGKAIYLVYSFMCHQLPERSFFLFGSKLTYSLAEIQAVWQNTSDPLILRQFIGDPQTGWKVAWSDRMISMYTATWIFALLWWPFRRRIKPLPWWGWLLFLAPMAVDGFSHMISDLRGIGEGFRFSNAWLAAITGYSLSPGFYAGDAWGSFNSIARWITGILFAIGTVWFAFPYLHRALTPQEPQAAGIHQRKSPDIPQTPRSQELR